MSCTDHCCLGATVWNQTFRLLGSVTRNVCEGIYFFLPFIRPSTEKTAEPHSHKPVVKAHFESVSRAASADEIKKASPFKAIFQAIAPAVQAVEAPARTESRPVSVPAPSYERVEKPAVAKVDSAEVTLKGLKFHDPVEAVRAEVYVKDFNSGTPRMRRDALDQIKGLPKGLAVEVLKRLMAEQNEALGQMEILDALSGLNDDGTLDKRLFKEHLKSPNTILRLAAVRAFSKYRDEESYEILQSATHDSDPEIRKRALSSILTSFESRTMPLALRALNDSDAHVRKTAAAICGILKIQQAISALITLLTDGEREVQKAANESLKKITGQDFDFNASGSQTSKREAVEAWRFWWRDQQASFGAPAPKKPKFSLL
jgi:hypothetical protein